MHIAGRRTQFIYQECVGKNASESHLSFRLERKKIAVARLLSGEHPFEHVYF